MHVWVGCASWGLGLKVYVWVVVVVGGVRMYVLNVMVGSPRMCMYVFNVLVKGVHRQECMCRMYFGGWGTGTYACVGCARWRLESRALYNKLDVLVAYILVDPSPEPTNQIHRYTCCIIERYLRQESVVVCIHGLHRNWSGYSNVQATSKGGSKGSPNCVEGCYAFFFCESRSEFGPWLAPRVIRPKPPLVFMV